MDQRKQMPLFYKFLDKLGHFGLLGCFKSSRFGLDSPLSLHRPAQNSQQTTTNMAKNTLRVYWLLVYETRKFIVEKSMLS
jgi:hypothetical protein